MNARVPARRPVPRHKDGHPGTVAINFVESRIDAIFAELNQCQRPGGVVGIAIGGKPVYRKGLGLANMELPVLLSPAMRMRIYSTSKHFTCLAYLLLCEEGRAGLDMPIGKILPELNAVTRAVTPRQLMGNISGLRDAHDICYQFSGTGHSVGTDELLGFYRDVDDVNFAPGMAWCYNNGGFLILTVAIERIAGCSLEEFLRKRIFEPVGLHDTLLRRFDTDFVPNSATMHTWSSEDRYEKAYLGTASAGEGGIVSTVDDMLRWLAHMDDPSVGTPATWTLMQTPQFLTNGATTDYGLGLIAGRHGRQRTVHHGGGGMGANSQMIKVPAAQLDVVVMLNRDDANGQMLANQILDACLGDDGHQETSQSARPVEGTFRSPITGRVGQLFPLDVRQIISLDGWDIPAHADSRGVLRPAGTYEMIKWELTLLGDPANPSAVRLVDFGTVDELIRVERSTPHDPQALVGSYRSQSTGTHIVIGGRLGELHLKSTGRFGEVLYKLEWLGELLWRIRSVGTTATFLGGILSFDADYGAFRFSNYRTRALRFQRDV